MLKRVNIVSSAATHMNRGSGARLAELSGVSQNQIKRLGRWNSDALTGLDYQIIINRLLSYRISHWSNARNGRDGSIIKGFLFEVFYFFIFSRALVDPPESLLIQIFPDLESSKIKMGFF